MLRIEAERLAPAIAEIFVAAGSARSEAEVIADHLVEANLLGHDSHGVIRVRKYVQWARANQVLPNRHAEIIEDRGAAVLIDGGFGYGQVIGKEAMEIAAERTAKHGFAVAATRNSGHLGRIGAWPQMVAERGFVSFHFVNTSGFGILVAPHGGRDRRLSANPVAAGTPVAGGPPLVLDIATSSIAEGKIQVAKNKGEMLPQGAVLDGAGRPTMDPVAFYADPPGAILPFGGHKGSGLSFFCEVLAGSLTGGFASNPSSSTAGRLVNNMLSIVIDPAIFGGADFFRADIDRLVEWTKGSPPADPNQPVLLPGEIELATRRDREAHGIPIDNESWAQITETAISLGVSLPRAGGVPIMSLRSNPVRARLRDGETCYGIMAVEFFTPGFCQIAANAGAEFVIFDMEHGGVGIDVLKSQIAFARGTGVAPFVRVPGLFYHLIAPVLDAGAMGIMVPMVETREQAEQLAAWCRYRPEGRRGLGFGYGHDDYSSGDVVAKAKDENARTLTIALIETAIGMENAEQILSVPGIDVGWLGHYDLTDSMGITAQFDHPAFHDAVAKLLAAVKRNGKASGFLATSVEMAREWRAKGFNCLCYGTDVAVFQTALGGAIATLHADASKGVSN